MLGSTKNVKKQKGKDGLKFFLVGRFRICFCTVRIDHACEWSVGVSVSNLYSQRHQMKLPFIFKSYGVADVYPQGDKYPCRFLVPG